MNGLFGRSGQNPQAPPSRGSSPYTRVPDGSQASLPSGPRTGHRVPPPPIRYDDPGQYEKRSYGAPSGGGGAFSITQFNDNSLAFTNCIIVNPADFPDGAHLSIRRDFVLTARHDRTGSVPPGSIAPSGPQRAWMGLSLNDTVPVSPLPSPPHPQAPLFLEALTIEVGFARRNLEIAEQFSADDMAASFIKSYRGIACSLGQQMITEYHGQSLIAKVVSVQVLELADNQRGGGGGGSRTDVGIVMDRTDVTIMKAADSKIKLKSSAKKAAPNAILAPNFKFEDMGIGGLDSEFGAIFRRAFASRVFPPALVEKLGIQHVKGILLHGPPGTGKTLMARQIGKMLNAREPKIVNGPEILNKYVGASEENIRKLFADAEKEYKEKGDESGLHIIIFDELDAVFKQRGSTNSGTGVGDTVVNQLLSKMDGVDQLNNILIIGMTNRKDMIDEALLRPGRLEVHMEISLPDEHGRLQILNIHTAKMRQNGVMDHDVSLGELAKLTKNFSGAEIGGLVKSATSFAFNRHVKVGTVAGISDDIENLRVNREDFLHALDEVQPAFGVSEEELQQVVQNGIIHYDANVNELLRSGQLFVEQVRTSEWTPLVSVLLHGPKGSGKTAMAATIAQASEFPFIKLITPDNMVGYSEAQKVSAMQKVFADSYKSPLSIVVVDNIERLLDWTPVGPRFSNTVLQSLVILMGRRPPAGHRLLVLATTSLRPMLTDVGLDAFDAELRVPPITHLAQLPPVLDAARLAPEEADRALRMLEQAGFDRSEESGGRPLDVGVKRLINIIERAKQQPDAVAERLTSELMGLGM
ncbi:AAA-domain-containing protein [Vararia minispora EC-137]|uniref:AAA-domain-containing protein n=1 Tax=Vararia minispora EC-137 TaxID=1314806 RepID=A0ACB8QGA6_9AGAM|nr:AAA-domain-containing protein [Vararia minispora EC-137]